VLHRSKRTIMEQAVNALHRIGDLPSIRRVLQGFGAGLFAGAQVSNAYE
jgi:hypothetical protein